MKLYLVPSTSARHGLPIIRSSMGLLKSYEPEVSKQLGVLLRKLPRLEAPFRFFKHANYAYESWLNSISDILATENATEELLDRAELALSGYLFASKAAIDHLRSHFLSPGIGDCPTWRDHDHIITTATGGRFYGGAASPHSRYKNLISYAWHEVAQKVRKHQIIVPDNQTLIAQLTSRRVKYAQDGRLWLENKQEMRERGVGSPDLADAFVLAFAMQPARSYSWTPLTNNWPEIARRHGWQYTGDSSEEYDDSYADRRSWNRLPPSDDVVGFGGVHSIW